jgi:glycosyltransferase involved in cell wall biosynthesis
MHDSLITIGITCFNAEQTIERAINSALRQNWAALEILVVDDCSTDHSVKIIEGLLSAHHNLRLVRHERNQGAAAARQTIVNNAKGEFIAFFDDDDESYPQRCRVQYERLAAYERQTGVRHIACYASGVRKYANGYEFDIKAIGSREGAVIGEALADYIFCYEKKPNMFYGAGTPTCALMIRKSVIESVGGFDASFRRVEDLDFAVRLALAGGHFIGCPEKLLLQHASSGQDKAPHKNLEAELQLVEKHRHYLEKKGRYLYARLWPRIRYYHFCGKHLNMLFLLMLLFLRYPVKTSKHFFQTAPRRLIHELKMKARR